MKWSRFVRNERGAAMVEMALVLPIVILLFLGMIDFGRAVFLYNNLTNAAREGARMGAAQVGTGGVDTVAVRQRVEQRIQDFSGQPAVSGKVAVTAPTTANQSVTVQIASYPFTPITPLPMTSGVSLSVTAAFRWEGSP